MPSDRLITVNFLAHHRRRYLPAVCSELAAASEETRSRLQAKILIYPLRSFGAVKASARMLRESGIPTRIVSSGNYMGKARVVARARTPLTMKHDEDVFMSRSDWATYVDAAASADWLTWDVLAPVISSGIPGCEHFLDFYASDHLRSSLRQHFAEYRIPNLWGVNFEPLAGTYRADDPSAFLEAVRRLETPYKGIHPVRLSRFAQEALIDEALRSLRTRAGQPVRDIVPLAASPYFCNNSFVSTTRFYREMIDGIDRGEFYSDGFDEVPLNQALDARGRKIGFVRDALAIHPSYNAVGEAYSQMSDRFFVEVQRDLAFHRSP